jgi:hypothetical protein
MVRSIRRVLSLAAPQLSERERSMRTFFLSTALIAGMTSTAALAGPVDLATGGPGPGAADGCVEEAWTTGICDGEGGLPEGLRAIRKVHRSHPQELQGRRDRLCGVLRQDEFTVVKGWDVLTDAASARSFGDAVAVAPRASIGGTALAVNLRKAANMLTAGRGQCDAAS